jgi:predicted signal transduction protein with EAL and GGDEF domain
LRLDDGSVISWSENSATEGGAVVIFEDVTERERAQARAEYLSTHDSLTGLPNRFMFDELLSNAVQLARLYKKPFGLMFVDLDRFKFVNDTFGPRGRRRALVRDGDAAQGQRARERRRGSARRRRVCHHLP